MEKTIILIQPAKLIKNVDLVTNTANKNLLVVISIIQNG